MDSRGRIHEYPISALDRDELEKNVGPLVPISSEELPVVQAMSDEQRRRWWFERATRREKKQARKRERAARKAGHR
jgi:thiamine pyrophosphate-dependent acetolactate synthase large subunit-like protein